MFISCNVKHNFNFSKAVASTSCMESRAGEPEPKPGVFGSLEPEPLVKKPWAGAEATWKKKSGAAGSSVLLEDKKHRKSVRLFLF